MKVLPVVERELREASRKRSSYRMRWVLATVAILIGAWAYMESISWGNPTRMGMEIFALLTVAAVVFCTMTGVFVTADCLSREKRQGTLGLLFLTDLKGVDVVLGKLVATSVVVSYGMLSVFPILAVPMIMGGVAHEEFGRALLVVANGMFFSLALGMFISTCSYHERKAIGATFLVLLVLNLGFPLLGAFLDEAGVSMRGELWAIPSMGMHYTLIFENEYKTSRELFWTGVIGYHASAWILLMLSSLLLPHRWQETGDSVIRGGWREWWRTWRLGEPKTRRGLRLHWLAVNPYSWVILRDRWKRLYPWGLFGGVLFIWLLGWSFVDWWDDVAMQMMTMLAVHLVLKVLVASEATYRLSEERRQGTLELLLSTPMNVGELLRGQFLALMKQFAGPIIAFLLFDLLMFAIIMEEVRGGESEFLLFLFFTMAALPLDCVALSWLGMLMAMRSKSYVWATAGSLGVILGFPVVAFAVLMVMFAFGRVRGMNQETILGLWIMLGLGTSALAIVYSHKNLISQFRRWATEPPRQGFLKRLFSR